MTSPITNDPELPGRTSLRRLPLHAGQRGGAVALEFALLMPMLLMMILASLEFGRAMMVYNAVTSAAREGARVGALPNGSSSEITSAVLGVLSAQAIPNDNAAIEILVNEAQEEAATAETGNSIQVGVSVAFQDTSFFPTPIFLAPVELTGRAVMRRE